MVYKGKIIKAHYTISIKTQLDSHTTIPSVRIAESHKIYNPNEVKKSLTAQSKDNSIAVAVTVKNTVNELVRKESIRPPSKIEEPQSPAPPPQPKPNKKLKFAIIDHAKWDEFARKLQKNAKKMKLDENFKLTVDEIIGFETKSLCMDFCMAFDKELDHQIDDYTQAADRKNIAKCQKLQLEVMKFKNHIEKGFERQQLSMGDYVTLLMGNLMRDINLAKFFRGCKYPEALVFVENRRVLLEAE